MPVAIIRSLLEKLGLIGPRSRPGVVQYDDANSLWDSGSKVFILTPRHTTFIATLIEKVLLRIGLQPEIIHEPAAWRYEKYTHIVIAPQTFKRLPKSYIVYQVEQSTSSRWFNRRYLRILRKAKAVLDYSIDNIQYLQRVGIPYEKIFYAPLAPLEDALTPRSCPPYDGSEDTAGRGPDVLFYGDIDVPRRQNILDELKKKFSVDVVSDTFGTDLYERIRRAKVVLNIHYYDTSLLETARIFECITLEKLVVSERSSDQRRFSGLENIVTFVDPGQIDQIVSAINRLISDQQHRNEILSNVKRFRQEESAKFQFFFCRFLLAQGQINFEQFYRLSSRAIKFDTWNICLSLPEHDIRSSHFLDSAPEQFEMFPGLRHSTGWLGCGLSYKFLFRKALDEGPDQIMVCEDDVEFHPHSLERLRGILDVLSTEQSWDVFVGLMADIDPDTQVTKLIHTEFGTLVFLDRMISMVFNVYKKTAFQAIAQWRPEGYDVDLHTIDRYLQRQSAIRAVTVDPFLVGHTEHLKSTIWNFSNTEYTDMINNSTEVLRSRIRAFVN